jgi:hypothetical protein
LGFDFLDTDILNKKANTTSGVFTKNFKVSSVKLPNQEELALVLISPKLALCK